MIMVASIASGVVFLIIITSLGFLAANYLPGFPAGSVVAYPAVGFVLYTAIIEFLCWYMVAFRMKTCFLVTVVCIISIAAISALAILVCKQKKLVFASRRKPNLSDWALIAAVFFIFVLLCALYRSDADDSFYVSNVALFSTSDIINPYDSSFGFADTGTVPMYDFQIWESLIAVYCRIFGVNAAVMCHAVLPVVLFIISVAAYYAVGSCLFEQKYCSLFVLFVFVLMLFGGYSGYSKGSFLLSRLWQGKAVYLNVVLPMLLFFVGSEKSRHSKWLWLYLLLCILSGISLNPTSLYVIGFGLLALMVSAAAYEKKASYLLSIIPSLIPIMAVSVLIYLRTSVFDGQIQAASQAGNGFVFQEFRKVFSGGVIYILLYAISAIYLAIRGTKTMKLLLVYQPVFLALVVWNPFIGKIIAVHITMTPSYWRVFWLLPLEITIAASVILAAINFTGEVKHTKFVFAGCISAFALVLAISGQFMFTPNNYFARARNLERLPKATLDFGSYIEGQNDTAVLLCPDELCTTVRQKYTDICLIYSREQYVYDIFYYRGRVTEAEDRLALQSFVTGQSAPSAENVLSLLRKYNVGYIAADLNCDYANQLILRLGYSCVARCGEYCLYEYMS